MVPKYSRKTSIAFPGEPLPPLDRMVGHVLHGWRDKPSKTNRGKPHTDGLNMGYRYGTKHPKHTPFPKGWTDQQIVDVIRDTIEHSNMYREFPGSPRREVFKHVNGVLVKATYEVVSGVRLENEVTGYPWMKKLPKEVKNVG